MTDRPEVRIELVSNPLYLSGARELVSSVARRLGFTDEACSQIALAVDEALCNVIRHGYGKAPGRPIWISLFPVGGAAQGTGANCAAPVSVTDALRIVIEDEAKQVDPATIKSRNLEDVRPGGLGVHIIRAVMDDVEYARRDGAGMRLTMVKKRIDSKGRNPSGASCGCDGEVGGSAEQGAKGPVGEQECGHA